MGINGRHVKQMKKRGALVSGVFVGVFVVSRDFLYCEWEGKRESTVLYLLRRWSRGFV